MFAGNTTANTINHVTKNRLAGNAANNSYQDINSKAKCANMIWIYVDKEILSLVQYSNNHEYFFTQGCPSSFYVSSIILG